MTPAQPGQIVAHGLREVPHVSELAHRLGAVPLRQLGAVWPVDQRDVRHGRNLPAERLIDKRLPRRIVHVVVPPNDVRDAHVVVVNHDGEVVGGRAIGTQQHKIVEVYVAEANLSLHEIVDHRLAFERPFEAYHVRRVGVVVNPVPPRRADGSTLRPGALSFCLQLFNREVAAVGVSGFQERHHRLAMAIGPGGLEDGFRVWFHSQPVQAFEDRRDGGFSRPFAIRVLDP